MTTPPNKGKSPVESGSFETSFDVIFDNGTSTVNAGRISIRPSLNFNAFQSTVKSLISHKTGIPQEQIEITVYYESGPVPQSSPARKRRNLVTHRFSFASIIGDVGNIFLAVLKQRGEPLKNKTISLHEFIQGVTETPAVSSKPMQAVSPTPTQAVSPTPTQAVPPTTTDAVSLNEFIQGGTETPAVSPTPTQAVPPTTTDAVSLNELIQGGTETPAVSPTPVCGVCDREGVEDQTAQFHACVHDQILSVSPPRPFGPEELWRFLGFSPPRPDPDPQEPGFNKAVGRGN